MVARLRSVAARVLLAIANATVPSLYIGYMWLVWRTSRIEDRGLAQLPDLIRQHNGAVAMTWHEEVFSVAWVYGFAKPHTLASVGDAGDLITRLLDRCGYVTFRGGSSSRESRRREGVLKTMIDHMKANEGTFYGLTPDGSKGPPYVVKPGALLIARECRKPVILVRTWPKRCIRLPTWDRMAIPLPFNHIRQYLRGPFPVPEGAKDRKVFEAFRLQMENELRDMAAVSMRF